MSESISALQRFIKDTRPLGVVYSGATDGNLNGAFLSAVQTLQSSLTMMAGKPVSILSGNSVNPQAIQIIQNIMNSKSEPKDSVSETKSEEKSEEKSEAKPADTQAISSEWSAILGKSLPFIGQVPADPAEAGHALEASISKAVGHSIAGTIWNDSKKSFNTTPNDVIEALTLLERNKKDISVKSSRDERFLKMSELLIK